MFSFIPHIKCKRFNTVCKIITRNCEKSEFLSIFSISDEEGYGKFLDLHECYEKFINLKAVTEKIEYVAYLQHFDKLFEIPKEKKGADYR